MFKGLGQLGDIAGLMKQAKEMQEKMQAVQGELEELIVEGEAAGGLVRAQANGKGILQSLEIDPSILRADSKEIVEDLIVTATRDAQERAKNAAQKHMADVTQGMPLPEGFQMPF